MSKYRFDNLFSPKVEIPFPTQLASNSEGFDFLADLHNRTTKKNKFVFNFSKLSWFEPHLSAVIGCTISQNRKIGASFEYSGLQDEFVMKTMTNNGLLELFDGTKRPSKITTGIPFKVFNMKSEDEVEAYIYKHVLLSEKGLHTSRGLFTSHEAKKRIFRSIFEIYQNSVMHSGADEIYVCGHKYLGKGVLALTMVEIGRTFKENVTTFGPALRHFSGSESIDWAVKSGNTTKISTETGGLGLDLIREFLKLNNGKLQIRSAEGFWEEKKGRNFSQNSKHPFSGSIVSMEFNLRDHKSYFIKEEFDIKDIL